MNSTTSITPTTTPASTTSNSCCVATSTTRSPALIGAAAIYGPQKGRNAGSTSNVLDAGLTHLGRLWRDRLGDRRRDRTPGAGAAGGMGGGMIAMLGAELATGDRPRPRSGELRTPDSPAPTCA